MGNIILTKKEDFYCECRKRLYIAKLYLEKEKGTCDGGLFFRGAVKRNNIGK